ncbi:amidohydrolase family protein [Stappia sp.]|uniref:amidohydrolase family protein n=1 Tax=Stappia sp. TaxID=1870903 RepID=UPI003A9A1BC0
MRVGILNIGLVVTGDLSAPLAEADTLILNDGRIECLGADVSDVRQCDLVIDAKGTTAAPGLIDSHVHITFGDFTPRQNMVGYLSSYVQGGVTTSISASEVHVPGRPTDRIGLKALALAARGSYENYRPGGMRVHAGSIILDPALELSDMADLARDGLWLAKAGFGAFDDAYGYAPYIKAAKDAGMITTVHTGGSSIPGSGAISGDHILALDPHVSFHVNGGPTAMPDADFKRLATQCDAALQICTAGNLRTALLCLDEMRKADQLHRLLIATDTPTGSGVMPLGMLYTISHLSALGGLPPEEAIACATGNNARVYGLDTGVLAVGKAADVILLDAPDGGTQSTALAAIAHGDIAAIGAVITDGVPRMVGRSRNTPATTRKVTVERTTILQDFSATPH